MSEADFKKAVMEKLDTLIKLVAVNANAQSLLGGKSKNDQIKILADLGLQRNIIALMVGTTPETVSVRLSEMKSKTKHREKAESESVNKEEKMPE